MLAMTLWAFTHGLIQLAMAKGSDMARFGIGIPELSNYGFDLLRFLMHTWRPSPRARAAFFCQWFDTCLIYIHVTI